MQKRKVKKTYRVVAKRPGQASAAQIEQAKAVAEFFEAIATEQRAGAFMRPGTRLMFVMTTKAPGAKKERKICRAVMPGGLHGVHELAKEIFLSTGNALGINKP